MMRFSGTVEYPDAPSRKNPVARDFLHWLVVNIPGSHVRYGEEIVSYMGPKPPAGSGPHRYFILVYKQPRTISVGKTSRARFETHKFISKNELGKPIAGNYFTVWFSLCC
ncbi:phosphatidylethanolamine-binding protein [Oesophagostomum dentatum]|uniref:Phosphatidylethanolamine-binding protein n=1 Tax=Oesophagostomum dentatum TaxID=61180 RepID=A0A0B1SWN0_OESDE|nr:phosphatidylethanolamine-binding protein [Oesophagostomum dentatum]